MIRLSYLPRPGLVFAVVAVLLAGGIVAMMATSLPQWVGGWSATAATLTLAAIPTTSVSAAAGAWIGALPRRQRFAALLEASTRDRLTLDIAALAPVLVASVVVPVVGGLVVGLVTAARADFEGPALLVRSTLALAAYTTMWACFGAALGRLLPTRATPAVALAAPYVLYVVATYSGSPLLVPLVLQDDRSWDYLHPANGVLLLQTGLAITLAVAVLTRAAGLGRVALAWGTAASAVLAVLVLVGGTLVPDERSTQVTCAGDVVVVCLDNTYRDTRGAVAAHVERLAPELKPLLGDRPAVLQDTSGRVAQAVPSDVTARLVVTPSNGNTAPAHLLDDRTFTAQVGEAVFLAPCTTATVPRGGEGAAVVLLTWWEQAHGLPLDGSLYPGQAPLSSTSTASTGQLERFAALEPRTRLNWFAAHHAQIRACTLTLGDLP